MSIDKVRMLAGGSLVLLLASGLCGTLVGFRLFVPFFSLAVGLSLLTLLLYLQEIKRDLFTKINSSRTAILSVSNQINSLRVLTDTQSSNVDKAFAGNNRILNSIQESDQQRVKSLGMIYRELKLVNSILSGADSTLSRQDEKRLTVGLLALKSTKRDLEVAIDQLAARMEASQAHD